VARIQLDNKRAARGYITTAQAARRRRQGNARATTGIRSPKLLDRAGNARPLRRHR
jgi:hypothetical protein